MPVAIVEENRGLLSNFCQLIKAGDLETVLKQLRTPEDQQRFAEEGLAWMAKNAPAPVAAPVVANLSEQHSGELDQVRAELNEVLLQFTDVRSRLNIANNRADALQRQVDDMGSRQELQTIRLSTLAQDLETLRGQLQKPTQAAAPITEQPPGPTEQAAPVPMVGKDEKAPRRSAKDT